MRLRHFSQWRTLRAGHVLHEETIDAKDVTPEVLAAILEVYVSNASRIFTYHSDQRRELIAKLAEELGVSPTLFREIASWWEDSGRRVSE